MAFDGNGTFIRSYNWTSDAANAIPILASRFDTEDSGFATGLSLCLTRDGQGKPSATIDWNSQRLTGLANAAAATDAVSQQFGDARYITYQTKRKVALTTRSSTINLANDPDLLMTIAAGTYAVTAFLALGNIVLADTNGFRWNLFYTGSITGSWISHVGFCNTAVSFQNALNFNVLRQIVTIDPFGINTANYLRIEGVIIASSGGVFSLQWAQNSSTTTPCGIDAGSWLRLDKIA